MGKPTSRRSFLVNTSLGIGGIAIASNSEAQTPQPLTPGAPPAFGTATPYRPASLSSDVHRGRKACAGGDDGTRLCRGRKQLAQLDGGRFTSDERVRARLQCPTELHRTSTAGCHVISAMTHLMADVRSIYRLRIENQWHPSALYCKMRQKPCCS